MENTLEKLRDQLRHPESQQPTLAQDCETKLVTQESSAINQSWNVRIYTTITTPFGGQALQDWNKQQQVDRENSPAVRAQRAAQEKQIRCRPYFEEKARREQAEYAVRARDQMAAMNNKLKNACDQQIEDPAWVKDTINSTLEKRGWGQVIDLVIKYGTKYSGEGFCGVEGIATSKRFSGTITVEEFNGKDYVSINMPTR
jgi:hypothetical protein